MSFDGSLKRLLFSNNAATPLIVQGVAGKWQDANSDTDG
jgi:hypothetical protein